MDNKFNQDSLKQLINIYSSDSEMLDIIYDALLSFEKYILKFIP